MVNYELLLWYSLLTMVITAAFLIIITQAKEQKMHVFPQDWHLFMFVFNHSNLLQKLDSDDYVMDDRGFFIEAEWVVQ